MKKQHYDQIVIESNSNSLSWMGYWRVRLHRLDTKSWTYQFITVPESHQELFMCLRFCFQAFYFDRDDVALPGFYKYFKKASDEEREHAEKLMKFQNQRGGRIVLQPIQVNNKKTFGAP